MRLFYIIIVIGVGLLLSREFSFCPRATIYFVGKTAIDFPSFPRKYISSTTRGERRERNTIILRLYYNDILYDVESVAMPTGRVRG